MTWTRDQKIMATQSPLLRLPMELKQMILSTLSDVSALKSTALTCSSFYSAFTSAEASITTHVLTNQLGIDILPEAIATLESQATSWTDPGVYGFFRKHLRSRSHPPKHQLWTLSQALQLGILHQCVQTFTELFVSQALSQPSGPGKLDHVPSYPPSHMEIARIQRAFYRFEIFCNLFRRAVDMKAENYEKRLMFLRYFSFWENEQLACVHDFLTRLITPVVYDIAEHDVLWGSFGITYNDTGGFGSAFVGYALSFGLVRLLAIMNADTYDIRYTLLCGDTPRRANVFIYNGLRSGGDFSNLRRLVDFTEQDEEKLACHFPPFVEESDTGPADAWRWAYQGETSQKFSYSDCQRPLLLLGYCMWDSARLDEWRIFAHPWHRPTRPIFDSRESIALGKVEWQSRIARFQIYEDGGRGWWSLGDESKIVWPPGGKAKHEARMKGKPWWCSDRGGKARKRKERGEIMSRVLERAQLLRYSRSG